MLRRTPRTVDAARCWWPVRTSYGLERKPFRLPGVPATPRQDSLVPAGQRAGQTLFSRTKLSTRRVTGHSPTKIPHRSA